ncbi:hypothetical protein [Pseudomonas aeruginosa]|jgi:hypothetical protein|uniref:hypothetical protein n=1 Tax=Pseudomonas aeruginosa TaxID=287 RepID=UPI00208EEE21|nr:hypothetical protein [Pseudomonas aeruginosa]
MHNTGERIILRLNASAMNALFPEGTQARVDLQNAVLTEAATKHVKGQLDAETRKYLEALVTTIANKVDAGKMIGEAFARKNHWDSTLSVNPTSPMAAAIAEKVRDEFAKGLEDIIEREVAARLPAAIEGIDARVQQLVDMKVNSITREMMRKKVNEAFAAAGLAPIKS